ncbi:acyl-CoA dehydrogenase family protein [Streptomyces sp. NPDC015501]|uniref:acyl-CoA dehydrogenase family protein n=1 Tax=unclassified Streptomyces TaxID=2593676 RepID=UPI0011A29C99|nr:acyl-CoA dehydrogenase [Streptomyces griseus subsp. griseus]WSS58882.1 acyl-CoA dehydrogenase family protein [Streptomyces sp. NBC_01178]
MAEWDDKQAGLIRAVRKIGVESGPGMAERDLAGAFDRASWNSYAEIGVHGLLFPSEYGGGGHDPLSYARIMEELGFSCLDNGLLMALGAHVLAVALPILEYGDQAQRATYLPDLVAGRHIGAHAMTEAESGSDALSMTTTARREGEEYVLNGQKCHVTNAPLADTFLVYATIDRALGFTGVTAFILERSDLGLRVTPGADKMGLRTVPWGAITLENCRVPASRRLGAEKQGAAVFARTMAWERSLILAPWLGVMRREIDECVRFARRRRQFGKHIAHFQSVSNRLVDMRMRWEMSRLIVHRAAEQVVERSEGIHAELGKLYTSESAVEVFTSALQLYGALGYARHERVDRNLRDALGMTLSSGTSDIQRNIIAGRLGLTWPDPEK